MMKKIVSLFLVSLAVLTLISCGKKEITTNKQAREAFVAAYEKQNAKSGALMDATFDFAATIDGMPMVFDGTMTIGYTVKPEFSAELDIVANAEVSGMNMSFPLKGYYEIDENELAFYINVLNTWTKTTMPYSQIDFEVMVAYNSVLLETIDEVVLKGKTEINETPVYELDVKFGDNTFSKMLEATEKIMGDAEVQSMEELFQSAGISVKEFDLLFAGLYFPVYLRQSDLSLYGCSVDLELLLTQLIGNAAEIDGAEVPPDVLSELDMSGSMTMLYRDGEPTGVFTVPQEARDTAVEMSSTGNSF